MASRDPRSRLADRARQIPEVDGPAGSAALSSIPTVGARVAAFAAVLAAGACGALIGWAMVGLQCTGSCAVPQATGAIVATILFAGGTAVVAVLALRAISEWKANQ